MAEKDNSAKDKSVLASTVVAEAAKTIVELPEADRDNPNRVAKALKKRAEDEAPVGVPAQSDQAESRVNEQAEEVAAVLRSNPKLGNQMLLDLAKYIEENGLETEKTEMVLSAAYALSQQKINEAVAEVVNVGDQEVIQDLKGKWEKETAANKNLTLDATAQDRLRREYLEREKSTEHEVDDQGNAAHAAEEDTTAQNDDGAAKVAVEAALAATLAKSAKNMEESSRKMDDATGKLAEVADKLAETASQPNKKRDEPREKEERPIPETFRGVQGEIRKLSSAPPDPDWERRLQEKQRQLVDEAKTEGVFGHGGLRNRITKIYEGDDYQEAISRVEVLAARDPLFAELDGKRRGLGDEKWLDYREMIKEYCLVAAELGNYTLNLVKGIANPNVRKDIELRGWGDIPWGLHMTLATKYLNRIKETDHQREERLANESRQHEKEMIAAQKDLIRRQAEASKMRYEVRRISSKLKRYDYLNADFVETHGLPVEICAPPPYGETSTQYYDMATLLRHIFLTGKVNPILSQMNIEYTVKGLGDEDTIEERVDNAQYAFGELTGALIPLMMARFRTAEGSIDSIAGNAKKGIVGVLQKGEGNIDFREVIPAFEKDELAKRALGILLAADGYEVAGVLERNRNGRMEVKSSDGDLALIFTSRFREIIEKGVIKDGRPALDKEAEQIQRACVAFMDNIVAKQIADYLKCDIGRVDLMIMMYTALGGGQRVIDYRELYQRFPVLREADPCYLDPKTGLVKGDVIMTPMIRKFKVGDDYRSRDGKPKKPGTGFGYVERALAEQGIDGLFDALLNLKDGHDAWKYWAGLGSILDAMKAIDDLQIGNDSLNSESARRMEIAKLIDPFANGDPPQISHKTLDAIKKMPVANGKGKLYKAGETPWDFGPAIRDAAERFGLT